MSCPSWPSAKDVLGVVYHGVSATGVNVGLRMNENLATRVGTDFQVRLYFSQKHLATPVVQDPFLAKTRTGAAIAMTAGGAAREVTIDFSGTAPVAKLAAVADGAWAAPAAEATITVGFATAASTDVLEVGIPYAALNFLYSATPATMDPLEMVVTAGSSTAELDRFPNANATVLFQDRSRMVEVTFILDATGTKLPLTAVKPIDNPPPPAGTGKAFIVGSLAELGNWKPNSIGMSDDGTTLGDATALDNYWTFRLLVPPLTAVNYKYTIGKLDDGWGASEEFPLTNRGFTVDDTNGDGKMVIVDVFADRPDPSGSMGARTTYTNP